MKTNQRWIWFLLGAITFPLLTSCVADHGQGRGGNYGEYGYGEGHGYGFEYAHRADLHNNPNTISSMARTDW
ncbi:hypothetical protein [Pedosphaera parvula]|uniref:hypothetical protein n=1 Tax=Pedosphaera parvula TaxID=1032527 RepID=UPI0003081665|nr:hypothetical protein [Pedosphaera parvula]